MDVFKSLKVTNHKTGQDSFTIDFIMYSSTAILLLQLTLLCTTHSIVGNTFQNLVKEIFNSVLP